jgi:hypothetical protein
MDAFSIANTFIAIANLFTGSGEKLRNVKRERLTRAAQCLSEVQACITQIADFAHAKSFEKMHGYCEELAVYAKNLRALDLSPALDAHECESLGARLQEAIEFRRAIIFANDLYNGRDVNEEAIRRLERASGSIRAASNLLRAIA